MPSHPANQGNAARIQVLAGELKQRGFALEFFYYGMEGLTDQQRTQMQAFWSDFHFMPSLPLPEPAFPQHWGVDDWCPNALCAAIGKLHAARRYDAVLVNYVWMSRVLIGLEQTLRIIDTHDLFAERHLVAIREGLEPRWFFTSVAEENRGFARADLLIGIQDNETRQIRARVEVEAMTVGHMIPPLFLTSFKEGRAHVTFGYLGSANPWNVRSVLALDAALATRGGAEDWLLAGSLLKRDMKFRSNPIQLGFVDRLEDFYSIVDCVVNPMAGGTGLKIKTVEALAYGKPVIGTIDAFEGLPARHFAHKLRDAAGCAAVMRAYRRDKTLRYEIKLASRMLYLEYLAELGQRLDRLAEWLLSGPPLKKQREVGIIDESLPLLQSLL